MSNLFYSVGRSNTSFTLNLGTKFDTSNVINMSWMFAGVGYNNPSFTLNLGSKFDTSNVTNMSYMFYGTGHSNTSLQLDLGSNFNTSKVTNMDSMFRDFKGKTIYVPNSFVTTLVTYSSNMFNGCTNLVGGAGTVFNSSYIDKTRAKIDGGTSSPGYFTAR